MLQDESRDHQSEAGADPQQRGAEADGAGDAFTRELVTDHAERQRVDGAARALVDNSAELAQSFSWWHWLVLLAILSGLNFHTVVRDVKDVTSNPLDAEALFRIGVEALTAAVLLKRLVNHQSSWLKELFRGLFGFLTLFVIISIASTFWSVNPLWSLYKSVEYGVDVVLIISLVLLLPSLQQYKKLLDWI